VGLFVGPEPVSEEQRSGGGGPVGLFEGPEPVSEEQR
jgi:hypothetical protein